METVITNKELEDIVHNIFMDDESHKIVISFPNKELYDRYMKEFNNIFNEVYNKPLDKTKRSKTKSI